MMLLAPPTPCEPPFAGSAHFEAPVKNRLVNVAQALHTPPIPHVRLYCTRPVASHGPKRPLSCFNSMHLAPHAPMRARTPSWAPIYRKYLRTTVNRARFCTWSCLLIPCELGPLADAKVIDRALVRCLAIEVARAPSVSAYRADGSNRLHGAHAGRPLAANRLPSASWHPGRLTCIFESSGRASQERQERIWAQK